MRWDRYLCGAALLALVVGASYWTKRSELSFDRVDEIKTRLQGHGYHFTSDALNGSASIGMLVSREAQEISQVNMLCKAGAMGRAWKGKIWITRNTDEWRLASVPDDAAIRTWGKFIAYGDGDFLAELEDLLAASGA